MRHKRIYDNQFIQEAINLVEKKDRNIGSVANSLGIPSTTLRQWVKKHNKNPGLYLKRSTKYTDLELENMDLKMELADAKLERDILKKAVAIFSKPQK